MIEKLAEMLRMQLALDQAYFKEYGTSYEEILANNGYFYAILDEVGEWNHERKSLWCWWKKSQKQADRKKELEEFVDILHFAMSRDLAVEPDRSRILWYAELTFSPTTWHSDEYAFIDERIARFLWSVQKRREIVTAQLLKIGEEAGYSFDEIYETYLRKNRTNFERLQNGY